MWKYAVLICFLAMVCSGEDLPEICKTFPRGAFYSCCEIPRLIAEVDWKRCVEANKENSDETTTAAATTTDAATELKTHSRERIKKFRHFMGKCYGDCVFEDAGLIVDGELDFDAVKELGLSRVEGNATWIPVMEESIANCTDAMDSISEERAKVCKTKADIFIMCLHGSLFRNCPMEFWRNDEKCDSAKEFFTTCPEILRHRKEQPADANENN
ncbi:general odorant-binding protein 67-like [Ctenocephalides felis]|uniref:general odorant-binding protein 67-like n=1 Tax=Ctenocephalides felis TaxID=7515 RepID=UPI000E6E51E8|nr:general odorant-binding protein 67-like [Ctenocephalides felis]XP_026474765.1 general odorant-binding protein 67-like [Ctenocephalides felis]